MVVRHRAPEPPAKKVAVVLPGHRPAPHANAYEIGTGTTQFLCTCGTLNPPAPPALAAAQWQEHLEIHMARSTLLSGDPLEFAGKSIYERLWEEMDAVYARLMAGEGAMAKGDKHYARGIAYTLAMMANPVQPNPQAIKDEVHRRWEEGTDALDVQHYNTQEG